MPGAEAKKQVHGVALDVAVDPDGPPAGVLILGAPGAGKTLLALELIDTCPWRRTMLVADDVVDLSVAADEIEACAPERLKGLIEVRGFGPAPIRTAPACRLRLVIDLDLPVERVPAAAVFTGPAGLELPLLPFSRDEFAAAARLRTMIRSILMDKSGDARRI